MNGANRLVVVVVLCATFLSGGVLLRALTDHEALFERALGEYRAGDHDGALRDLQEALKTAPDFAPAHELIGLIFSTRGQKQEGLSHLRRATELWPNNAVYWANLAIFYLRESQIEKAENALRRSFDAAPTPQGHTLLGIIRLDQQRNQEAIALLKRSTALSPRDLSAWYYLGLAYQAVSDIDGALAAYQECLRLDPKDFASQRQIGILYLNRGRYRLALDHLLQADTLQREDAEIGRYLSQAYLHVGDLERALEAASRAVRLAPDDRQAHYQMGLVLTRRQMTVQASEEFALSEKLPNRPQRGPLDRWREISERKALNPGSQ